MSERAGAAVEAEATPARSLREHWRGVGSLLIVTAIWGTTFAVIKDVVDQMLPGSLILARFALAGITLSPVLLRHARRREVWFAGLQLGGLNWLGYTTQAVGLTYTTASRSAFITALSVVLVPAFAGLLGRKVGRPVQAAALMALIGVGLLAWDGAPPNRGDLWTLATAVTYALYVLRLASLARRLSTPALTLTQVWGVVPFALFWALVEVGSGQDSLSLSAPIHAAVALQAHWRAVPAEAWLAVAYLAIAATALTTALQTFGQARVSASEAAVIYTSEPVWASLFAALLLGERFGARGWAGASMIVLATLVGQWRAGRADRA